MRRQSGYGFVHYSITGEGIHAAIRAASTLDDITVESVNYKCSLSHNLNKYLTGELTMPAEDSQIPGLPQQPSPSGHPAAYTEDLGLIDSDYFFQSSAPAAPPVPQQQAYPAATYRQQQQQQQLPPPSPHSGNGLYGQNQSYGGNGAQQGYQPQAKTAQYTMIQGQGQQQGRMQQQGYRPPVPPHQPGLLRQQQQRATGAPAQYSHSHSSSIHPELAQYEPVYDQRLMDAPQYSNNNPRYEDNRYKVSGPPPQPQPPPQGYQQHQSMQQLYPQQQQQQQQQQQPQQFVKPYYPEGGTQGREFVNSGQAAHSVLRNAFSRSTHGAPGGGPTYGGRQVPYSSGSATLAALGRAPIGQHGPAGGGHGGTYLQQQQQQQGYQQGLRQAPQLQGATSAPSSTTVSPTTGGLPGPINHPPVSSGNPPNQRWSTGSYNITPPSDALQASAPPAGNGRPGPVTLSKAPVSSVIAPRQQSQQQPGVVQQPNRQLQAGQQGQQFAQNNNGGMMAPPQQHNFAQTGNDFQMNQNSDPMMQIQQHQQQPQYMEMPMQQQQQNIQYQQQNGNQYIQQTQQPLQQQMFQQQAAQQQQQQAQSQFANVFSMNAAVYANNSSMLQAATLNGMAIHVSPPMSPLESYAASPLMPHNTALFNPFMSTGFSPLFTTVQGQLSPYIPAATMSPMLSPASMMPRDIMFEENMSNAHNLFTPATFYQSSPVLGVRDLHCSPGYMHNGNFTAAGGGMGGMFGHQNGAYVSQPLDLKMYAARNNKFSPKTEARTLRGDKNRSGTPTTVAGGVGSGSGKSNASSNGSSGSAKSSPNTDTPVETAGIAIADPVVAAAAAVTASVTAAAISVVPINSLAEEVAELRVDVVRVPVPGASISETSFFGSALVEGSPLEKDTGYLDADIEGGDNTTTESAVYNTNDAVESSSNINSNAASPAAKTPTGVARRSLIMRATKQLVA